MTPLTRSLVLSVLVLSGCATYGPFTVGIPYGAPVVYGKKRHPGIDFNLSRGTAIVAVSDGDVIYVGDPCPGQPYCGGILVVIQHGDDFRSVYGHLAKVFVEKGQALKRGRLIGLSGASNSGYAHLHFGICRTEGSCINYSQTNDPKGFWLDGEPKCFDPGKDYSKYPSKAMTLPVACPEYAKTLNANQMK